MKNDGLATISLILQRGLDDHAAMLARENIEVTHDRLMHVTGWSFPLARIQIETWIAIINAANA